MVHRQYRRWTASGLWDLMLDALADGGGNNAVQMVDSTVIRAHHCAAGASDAIRDRIRASGGQPEIPTKKNRRVRHSVNQMLYATRNRIERFFNRLKTADAWPHATIIHRQQLPRLRQTCYHQTVYALCPRSLARQRPRSRRSAGWRLRFWTALRIHLSDRPHLASHVWRAGRPQTRISENGLTWIGPSNLIAE
jgi:hypothetical protein